MNPAAILALIGDLYAQLNDAQQRAATAEARVVDLESAQQQEHREPEGQHE